MKKSEREIVQKALRLEFIKTTVDNYKKMNNYCVTHSIMYDGFNCNECVLCFSTGEGCMADLIGVLE